MRSGQGTSGDKGGPGVSGWAIVKGKSAREGCVRGHTGAQDVSDIILSFPQRQIR